MPQSTINNQTFLSKGSTFIKGRTFFTLQLLTACCLLLTAARAQDYTITTTGSAIIITDVTGTGETMAISQSSTNIRFVVTPTTRTYSINGGPTTAFTTPADAALAGATSITLNNGNGNDIINIAAFTASLPTLTVNGGTGDDAVNLNGDITFAANANLDIDLQNDDPTPGTDMVAFAGGTDLLLSGTGSATIKASKTITLSSLATLKTANGNLTLEANQQATPTSGTFKGIDIGSSSIVEATGIGIVTIKGKGGNSGALNMGVFVYGAGKIKGGTTGTNIIEGIGGTSTGNNNNGVYVYQTNSAITTNGGNINVTGYANGSTASSYNYGIYVRDGAQITTTGSGTVTVNGTGATSASGSNNYGVSVDAPNSKITSAGGNVSVTGLGGGGSGNTNHGIYVYYTGTITAGGTGTVTVTGTGGSATGSSNYGISVVSTGSSITSSGGHVIVNGQGGGSSSAGSNFGINVGTTCTITAGGSGTVTVTGTGGATTGITNHGVYISGATSSITSGGGNVNVTGHGGGTTTSTGNYGIQMTTGGIITAGGTGTVTVSGTGGTTTGNQNYGVSLSGINTAITSAGGNVSVTGIAGGSGASGSNYGVIIASESKITAGSTGTVTVNGTGANAIGIFNYGVYVTGTNAAITSGGGNVNVTGTGGGSSTSRDNYGVTVQAAGKITATGTGTVTVSGTGGAPTGNTNIGVYVTGSSSLITSAGGNVSVTGQGGGSGASANNYGIGVQNGGLISVTGSGTVSVTGTGGISTGTANDGIYIVNSGATAISSPSGAITITGTRGSNSASSADVNFYYGYAASTSTTAGITINSTTGGTWTNLNGTDVSTDATQSTTFGAGSKFNVEIDGTVLNSSYQQLNVVGMLNLNNATLTFTGSGYSPVIGNTFTIVANDGSEAITGTFNGLAQGAIIPNFLGSANSATISYTAGTGNDVVLTVVAPVIAWDGSSNNDWNVAANWSNNAVPAATDNITIPNLSNDPVISGSFTINNIDLASGATLTIANGGSLTLNGALTNAGAITIQSGGSFLQGGSSSYAGAGTFTVQRQGTSSATKYNYWSTPVAGGTLPGTNGYQYISAAGTNSNTDDIPGPDPGWSSFSGAMTTGKGYASQGGNLASFTGTPNNGNITTGVTYYGLAGTSTSPNSDFVLLGNPYPSGLTVNTFLTDNAARLSGQLWAWDDDNTNGTGYSTGDYASRTTAGSTSGGNGNSISAQVASCQGFMVKAISTGTVAFNNAQRNATAGTFLKTEEEISRIWLSLANDTLYNELNIVFMESATNNFDQMLDGQKLRGNAHIAFAVKPQGSNAVEDELCIAALPPVSSETVIALTAFVANEGIYTIRNKAIENFSNLNVYLEDRLTGSFTNLNNSGEYATLMNAQNTTDRFFLHIAPQATAIAEHSAPPFTAYISGNELMVLVTSSAVETQTLMLTLTDLTGKTILTQKPTNSQSNMYRINLPYLSAGIYVVSLQTTTNVYSSKIIVK